MDYQEFSVTSGAAGKQYQCHFRTLMTAISLRHSDTADVSFLVNGKPVIVALPLTAFAEHRDRTGEVFTDAETIQIAGCFLKEALESEGLGEDRMLVPSIQRTLDLAASIRAGSPKDHPSVVPRTVTS